MKKVITMNENLTLEQANEMLEVKVKKLQESELNFDEFVKNYEEICELLNFCYKKITVYGDRIKQANDKIAWISEEGSSNE